MMNHLFSHSALTVKVGHSPDPDDAFMFYALAKEAFPTPGYHFTHDLVDIETLNHRAKEGFYELTALSLHAYAYLHEKYILCPCGASMGDGYGPMIVAKNIYTREELRKKTIAVPGTLTTAFLACGLYLEAPFHFVLVPFDEILDVVEAGHVLSGENAGQEVHAGLIIHEGQLTYERQGLKLIVDTGAWWQEKTGFPLPLGANGIRRDLGENVIRDINDYLLKSIRFGLEHRQPALEYALQYGRGLDTNLADRFVGMYVNDWTLDFGSRGKEAVSLLLKRGYEAGLLPELVVPEFV
ncbi:MAG: ABC transporter substrate-binding protein [Planctomycetia bacterium]|nr:ABC transporter substrate-binding protein [Planctomycetia bacterium]